MRAKLSREGLNRSLEQQLVSTFTAAITPTLRKGIWQINDSRFAFHLSYSRYLAVNIQHTRIQRREIREQTREWRNGIQQWIHVRWPITVKINENAQWHNAVFLIAINANLRMGDSMATARTSLFFGVGIAYSDTLLDIWSGKFFNEKRSVHARRFKTFLQFFLL